MTTSTYRIADEPARGPLTQFGVNTHLPMLAWMLGGGWIGIPWFAFNAFAIGSATKRREVQAAILYPFLSVALALALFGLVDALHVPVAPAGLVESLGLPGRAGAYAVVLLITVKMAFVYFIQMRQAKSYLIFEYFAQPWRYGALIVVVAALLRGTVIGGALKLNFWFGLAVL